MWDTCPETTVTRVPKPGRVVGRRSRSQSETYVPDFSIDVVETVVETMGIEPTTSGLQSPRSTN
jgi:hypothetical protein